MPSLSPCLLGPDDVLPLILLLLLEDSACPPLPWIANPQASCIFVPHWLHSELSSFYLEGNCNSTSGFQLPALVGGWSSQLHCKCYDSLVVTLGFSWVLLIFHFFSLLTLNECFHIYFSLAHWLANCSVTSCLSHWSPDSSCIETCFPRWSSPMSTLSLTKTLSLLDRQ